MGKNIYFRYFKYSYVIIMCNNNKYNFINSADVKSKTFCHIIYINCMCVNVQILCL